ncbi:glutamate-5-semialdehyde dehydrogenase [Anditalea andensis]|uniref:Gamma-glutamyl phosphate reductase n=1 Tax=Anditalea andensis TaxID=1048983 RepID=A0A074L6R1_9BACT|nr:glutamate-5-semialdehyde dehydrogenase [Anditalea andensis]KEO75518.1 gamma-glutamyl phosphate reductase [Anditalea andensis]
MTILPILDQVRKSSRSLNGLTADRANKILLDLANMTLAAVPQLLEENKKDLEKMDPADPKYDRLKLTEDRIRSIAEDMRKITELPSPLSKILEEKSLDNGLYLQKVTVPIGVIGIIYEARPNVTFDVFSLCLKSGNALVLKGGSDAHASNTIIVNTIQKALQKNGIDPHIVTLLPAGRASTNEMLIADKHIDIIIPRGSQALIDYVRENAKVPVIETGAGIVHTYFDETADLAIGTSIIENAKTRRVSVCNALDCLIIHQNRLGDLGAITERLAFKNVILYADPLSYSALKNIYPNDMLFQAEEEHFGTEFLSLTMSIRTVADIDEALEHIARYSSKHSEAIIAEKNDVIEKYVNAVDAAAVYVNTSTAFTDGGQFGMGAEIGISTQKLHARGPMGLEALVTYKWIIKGKGQIRP